MSFSSFLDYRPYWDDNLLPWRFVCRPLVRPHFYLFSNSRIFLKFLPKIIKNNWRCYFLFFDIFIFHKMAAFFAEKRAFWEIRQPFSQNLFSNFF